MVALPAFFSSSPSVLLRSKFVIFTFTALLIVTVTLIWMPLLDGDSSYGDSITYKIPSFSHTKKWRPTELKDVKSKYAFATFLAGDKNITDDDPFFIGVRLLAYQLLHANDTASRDKSIPLVVLVTENVSEDKRLRLQKDGAVVVEGKKIDGKWVVPKIHRWEDVMTKLRLWELTQFERICQLDGDTVLNRPMDGVFDDPAVKLQTTIDNPKEVKGDEGKLPATYSFAGFPEMNKKHEYPPTEENHGWPWRHYLNAGFFVFRPSKEMLDYYFSLFETPDRFNNGFPEQNLFNYAHRSTGNMPWTLMNNTWNLHMALQSDIDGVDGGVASVHSKWWDPIDKKMLPWMAERRWRMEGYFEAMDKLRDNA